MHGTLNFIMENKEAKSPSRYAKPPWLFEGRALYQLHLVKVETARAFIPREFRLVEAFGYTLGGFCLANYDDSPAGIFDELVVIAGLVWNPPTSCAWASRVLVNSEEACIHGRRDVGLPSQLAKFSKVAPDDFDNNCAIEFRKMTVYTLQRITAIPKSLSTHGGIFGIDSGFHNINDIKITEMNEDSTAALCNFNLVTSAIQPNSSNWKGPLIKMSLPSFSGRTQYNPNLLKYSCRIQCRVRAVSPAKVSAQSFQETGKQTSEEEESRRKLCTSVMTSKPILALEFSCLKMAVEPPVVVVLPQQPPQ